jgi:hypothetical protein
MVALEKYECRTKIDAQIREQLYINQLENKLNMRQAYSSVEEKKDYKKISKVI